MWYLIALIVLFQIKHYVCDYPLQGTYMLGKLKGRFRPLLAHVTVHGMATFFLLVWIMEPQAALLFALADAFTHFWIDRWKVKSSAGLDPKTSPKFWNLLGIDQMAHHFVHYTIIIVTLIYIGVIPLEF